MEARARFANRGQYLTKRALTAAYLWHGSTLPIGGPCPMISSNDKFIRRPDPTVGELLALDGTEMEIGDGWKVRIKARRVEASGAKPHGLDYSLCLFGPDRRLVLCYDNAHPVRVGSGPAARRTAVNDHFHRYGKARPYGYTTAETLMLDFWTAAHRHVAEENPS